MSKVRVYEVAKQLNLDPKAVVSLFQAVGVNEVRNHMSSVDADAIERVKRHIEKQKGPVVEERIRPGVLKRRAAVKPAVPEVAPSTPAVPPLRARDTALTDDRESTRLPAEAPNGHAAIPAAEPSGARLPPARESIRELPQDRRSARELEPVRTEPVEVVPADRPSGRQVVPSPGDRAVDGCAASGRHGGHSAG